MAPDGMPCFAGSIQWLFCFSMSHKKGARLIWVKWDFNTLQNAYNTLSLIFYNVLPKKTRKKLIWKHDIKLVKYRNDHKFSDR